MTGFVNEANAFEQDNFLERRNATAAAGVAYDPESLLTGAEEAAGLGYRDKRVWPDQKTFIAAVAGTLTPEQIAEVAPRRKATPVLKPVFASYGISERPFPE